LNEAQTPSLFDAAENRALVARISRLSADARPQWGKLSVSRMLVHCQRPLEVATGELKLQRNLIGFLFGGLAKRKLTQPGPFSRNMPTAPQFKVAEEPEFGAARAGLVRLVERFAAEGPGVLSRDPHPFFGPLTQQEWDTLQWKHLDHHLRQFGV